MIRGCSFKVHNLYNIVFACNIALTNDKTLWNSEKLFINSLYEWRHKVMKRKGGLFPYVVLPWIN
jgi:hypothetical protein